MLIRQILIAIVNDSDEIIMFVSICRTKLSMASGRLVQAAC